MGKTMPTKIYVNNVPEDACKFIVSRTANGELWFWGSWDDKDKAQETADEMGGYVTERMD